MQKKFKDLPPIDILLYNKVHDYVEQNVKEHRKHQKQVVEQKILYILQSISLYYYAMPLFNGDFIAMKEGPVNKKILGIQEKNNSVSDIKRLKNMNKENYPYFQQLAENLFELLVEGVENQHLPLDSKLLSDLTHNEVWENKYKQREGAKRYNNKVYHTLGKLVNKDLLSFYENNIKNSYPELFEFINTRLTNSDITEVLLHE